MKLRSNLVDVDAAVAILHVNLDDHVMSVIDTEQVQNKKLTMKRKKEERCCRHVQTKQSSVDDDENDLTEEKKYNLPLGARKRHIFNEEIEIQSDGAAQSTYNEEIQL